MTAEGRYEAFPFVATPDRADIVSRIMREIASKETIFTDYYKACEAKCWACDQCLSRLAAAANVLSRPNALVWEIWEVEPFGRPIDVVGILYLTGITYGVDATAHYFFFDGRLLNKTELLKNMLHWGFQDHLPGWKALRRITIEVPIYMYAQARHAYKRLGFGGSFSYNGIKVEGVKRNAITWRGEDHDILILGLLNAGR